MKILNIYGQKDEHSEAKLVGNHDGLLALRDALNRALVNGKGASTSEDYQGVEKPDPLYASDGEGYRVTIEVHDDEWGNKAPADSFWNQEESDPQYCDSYRDGLVHNEDMGGPISGTMYRED